MYPCILILYSWILMSMIRKWLFMVQMLGFQFQGHFWVGKPIEIIYSDKDRFLFSFLNKKGNSLPPTSPLHKAHMPCPYSLVHAVFLQLKTNSIILLIAQMSFPATISIHKHTLSFDWLSKKVIKPPREFGTHHG